MVRTVMCAWMEVTCVVLQLSTLSFIIVVDWVTIVALFVIKLPLCNVCRRNISKMDLKYLDYSQFQTS